MNREGYDYNSMARLLADAIECCDGEGFEEEAEAVLALVKERASLMEDNQRLRAALADIQAVVESVRAPKQ